MGPGRPLFSLLNTFFTWLPETKLTDFWRQVFVLFFPSIILAAHSQFLNFGSKLGSLLFSISMHSQGHCPQSQDSKYQLYFYIHSLLPWNLFLLKPVSSSVNGNSILSIAKFWGQSCHLYFSYFTTSPSANPFCSTSKTNSHYSYFYHLALSHHQLSLGLMQLKSINWQVPHSNIFPNIFPSQPLCSFLWFLCVIPAAPLMCKSPWRANAILDSSFISSSPGLST